MSTSTSDSENGSLYRKFVRCQNNKYDERPSRIPTTSITLDGSILYENNQLQLLESIVCNNDTNALDQYLTVAPWAVPCLPPSEEEIEYSTRSESDDVFYIAANRGYPRILQMLLAHCTQGEDSTTEIRFDRMRFNLLNDTARWGHVDVAQFLLDHQPLYSDIHERDSRGKTAILSAADFYEIQFMVGPGDEGVSPAKNEAVINLLLDYGACATDVNAWNEKGQPFQTVLTLAVQWAGSRLIERLLDCGADVHGTVIAGCWSSNGPEFEANALYFACSHANFNAVRTLIERRGVGVEATDVISSRDSRGCLALHWTAHFEPPDCYTCEVNVEHVIGIIELLADIDPSNINAQDHEGNTPLHHASGKYSQHPRCSAIFEILLKRGADATLRNNKGETPLHTLLGYDCWESIEVDTTAISTLLLHGVKITDVDVEGNTPLHVAARKVQYISTFSFLLEQGGNAALHTRNTKQDTPAHVTARTHRFIQGWSMSADYKTKAQDGMLGIMVEAGGVELMDLTNAEGKSPKDICQETRDEWRKPPIWARRGNAGGRGRGRGRG